jgi:hypothetical protein
LVRGHGSRVYQRGGFASPPPPCPPPRGGREEGAVFPSFSLPLDGGGRGGGEPPLRIGGCASRLSNSPGAIQEIEAFHGKNPMAFRVRPEVGCPGG